MSGVSHPARALGPPDLAVEILSPSTAAKDRDLKLELYRQAGVPEYWIVDPEAHQVTVYHLDGATWTSAADDTHVIKLTRAQRRQLCRLFRHN